MDDFELLIVDDDLVIQTLHQILVIKNKLHMSPKKHLDGMSALTEIQDHGSDEKKYLILLDINMPVMSGWDFMDRLNQLSCNRSIKVVIVSSSIDSYDILKSKEYHQIISYYSKPLSVENIREIKTKIMFNHISE